MHNICLHVYFWKENVAGTLKFEKQNSTNKFVLQKQWKLLKYNSLFINIDNIETGAIDFRNI